MIASLTVVAGLRAQDKPQIVRQPWQLPRLAGSTAVFTVEASGSSPLFYQWQKDAFPLSDNSRISGATTTTLTIANVQSADMGLYSVVVSNVYGVATSSSAPLVLWPLTAWGCNDFGQTEIPLLSVELKAVAAGRSHNLALLASGQIVAWGRNDAGQINVPSNLFNVVAIAAGYDHSLALNADRSVTAWGSNGQGQTDVPPDLTNVVAVAGGPYHSLALQSDGTVMAWGSDASGQTDVPADLASVVAIAAGGEHSLALKADASVVFWGSPDVGALTPPDLDHVLAIAAGERHCLALKDDGRVVAWGDNHVGQTNVPPDLSHVVRIAAGGDHSLAVTDDGSVFGWGGNDSGQSDVPILLSGRQVAIAAGFCHSLALGDQCWFPPSRAERSRNPALGSFSPCVLPAGIPVTMGATDSRLLDHDGFSPLTAGETKSTSCGSIGQNSLWLHLEPQTNGTLILDTLESTTNTVLAIYQPTTDYANPFLFWATLRRIACGHDNTPGHDRSQVCFEAQPTNYLVAVDAFRSPQDKLRLRWRMGVLPAVDNLLTITLRGTNALICWPDSCKSYTLQVTSDLVGWQDVTSPPVFKTNGCFCTRQGLDRTARFYRLRG